MRIVVLYSWIVASIAGCSMLPTGPLGNGETDKGRTISELKPVPPPQPVGFVQDPKARDPYTGTMPYVICFGADCGNPTPKTPPRREPPPQRVVQAQPVIKEMKVRETRIQESVSFEYNTTTIERGSAESMEKIMAAARTAKEVVIKGMAGLTATNIENEQAVMNLALSRARVIERMLKTAGTPAHITISAHLVRCESEPDCLKRFKDGGRRADVEIVIIEGEKNAHQHQ